MNQTKSSGCACGGSVTILLPCSGAADTGEIADRAARKFAQGGCAGMFCLAGVGANISGFIASAKGADRLLVLDGCNLDCARKTLAEKGITANIIHLRVTDMGFVKGKSPATAEHVDTVVAELGKKLTASL
ncbi:MAG: putative zinc-binding protein [Acidobacteria bacterium]|nr:putative zinc-binding protein [Acidobacteriota bacterium]MBU4308035.1 putative zinc-binding protein [Acidobacteriota bacterium]MBU4405287.1 putative zinc-binding protein [Acidobacteriota bacterium]MCG2810060.1 putative zinc-binding protein [Candidatus Aminicenantes bacterium]